MICSVMRKRILTFLFVTAVFAACQEPMEPVSTISKFRLLAVQAEPPEVRPGRGVTHRVLYADPDGDGREISFVWLTCMGLYTPSSDFSAAPCELLGFKIATASDGGDTYEISAVPENALADLPEDKTYQQATTVVSMCGGGETPDISTLTDAFQAGGDISISDILDALCVGGEGLTAFKTFRISAQDASDTNTNPTIDTLMFNGNILVPSDAQTGEIPAAGAPENRFVCETTAECLDGADISATLTQDSFEFYEEVRLGKKESVDESPYISWFVDGGELSVDRSRAPEIYGDFGVSWSPPLQGGRFTLYVVAHDLRGGTSWKQYAVEAQTGTSE
jgi:hypothetical protein